MNADQAEGATLDMLDRTFEAEFKRYTDKLKELKTRVLLVPSIKDTHHMYPFPQPPFQEIVCILVFLFIHCAHANKKNTCLHMLSNPATVAVNGLSIGVTSMDIINLMINEEKAKYDTRGWYSRSLICCIAGKRLSHLRHSRSIA